MKIEITCDDMSGCSGCKIWANGKRVMNLKNTPFRQYEFTDEDISMILTDAQFDKFLNKGVFVFDVPAWKIKAISGDMMPTQQSNKFTYEYNQL